MIVGLRNYRHLVNGNGLKHSEGMVILILERLQRWILCGTAIATDSNNNPIIGGWFLGNTDVGAAADTGTEWRRH